MKFLTLRSVLVTALSFLALMGGGNAHAAFRSYLSGSGNDANPCTLVAPCRLLPAALTAVDPGGEIWILDSANYNTAPVTISKSVTILAIPGQVGSVVGINGTAFSISGAGIDVTLKNLNILSFANSGDIGVLIGAANQVSIIDCNIFGFNGLNANSNNGLGIWVTPGSNVTKVNIVGSIIQNNSRGIVVEGNGRATISKTHVLGNSGPGIWAIGSSNNNAVINVSDSVSSGNVHGFMVSGCAQGCSGQMYVTTSVATENSTHGFTTQGGTTAFMVVGYSMSSHNGSMGFDNTLGAFQSRGNNTVSGNFNAQTNGTITSQAGI